MRRIAVLTMVAGAAAAPLAVAQPPERAGPPEGAGPPANAGPPSWVPPAIPDAADRLNAVPAAPNVRVAFVVRGTATADATDTSIEMSVEGGNAHGRRALAGATSVTVTLDADTKITKDDAVVEASAVVQGDPLVVIWMAPFGAEASDLPAARRVVVRDEPDDAEDAGEPEFELSARQLLINQRVAQAAVRRANAVLAALEGEDPAAAASASGTGKGSVELSARQLGINQRISQAAVRRTNEARAKLDGREPPPASDRARSRAAFGLSVAQLAINQRISQAAVRRANALIAELKGVGDIAGELPPAT